MARKWLGSGSWWFGAVFGVARKWLGSGSEVARKWLVAVRGCFWGGSDVARKWLGSGSWWLAVLLDVLEAYVTDS